MSNEHVNSTVRSILDTICPPAGATTGVTMGEPVKPVAYLDEKGSIVVIGQKAMNRTSFIHDDTRAIPYSWVPLVPMVSREVRG